jgi:mannose-6-phosphate isomerase-like protein (cupin superfamily)
MAATQPYVPTTDDYQRIEWIGGGVLDILLDAAATGGRLGVVRATLPSSAASPVHVHEREDEVHIVLSGAGIFWAGDKRYEVGAGGLAYLPRGVPHAYRLTADCDILTLSTPAGVEQFFRDAGWDVSRPKPDGWALTPAVLAAAGAAAGQRILGPPLGEGDAMPASYLQGA